MELSPATADAADAAHSATRLRVDSLVFSYGQRWLFEGFSAHAGAGVTWLQGPNGSGKSSLLRLLAGALRPQHGGFELAGRRYGMQHAQAPLAWREQTFWCPSDAPPTPWLNIGEWLAFVSSTYEAAAPERLHEELDALGLASALSTPLRHASLGEQRKAWLALALALPVKLLLLDEPFNALDSASARYLAEVLTARAASGAQVIVLTSHVEPQLPLRGAWHLGGR